LLGFAGPKFDLNVSIFVDIDISDQANIFSTVNLAQTKVNRSLAYDLFDLAKSRSPEKTCHLIAVALDKQEKSPFYKKIKRLGVSTDGRFDEKITQATLVKSLLPYISDNPSRDRDLYLRGKKPKEASAGEIEKMIFRNMFLEEKDLEIAEVLFRYFSVVKNKWSQAWGSSGTGDILNRTNGFRALMRFLRPVYLYLGNPGMVPTVEQFSKVFDRIDMKDSEFNVDNFKPGTSGESKLYLTFLEKSRLQG
jgi:DGQHR domain-containing protein